MLDQFVFPRESLDTDTITSRLQASILSRILGGHMALDFVGSIEQLARVAESISQDLGRLTTRWYVLDGVADPDSL